MKAFTAILACFFVLTPLTSLHSTSLSIQSTPTQEAFCAYNSFAGHPHTLSSTQLCHSNSICSNSWKASPDFDFEKHDQIKQPLKLLSHMQTPNIQSVFVDPSSFASDHFDPAHAEVRWEAIDWYSSLSDICGKKAGQREELISALFTREALEKAGIHLPSVSLSNDDHEKERETPSIDRAQSSTSAQDSERRERAPKLNVHVLDAPRTRGRAIVVVAPEDNTAFVSIRGSVCATNFLQALKCWPRHDELTGVTFHAGFYAVAQELQSDLENIVSPGMQVLLTGHSMGGAVASILSLLLQSKGRDIAQVVSFGSPKHVWAAAPGSPQAFPPILRVEHPLDPIPAFPSSLPDLIFRPSLLPSSPASLLQPPSHPLPESSAGPLPAQVPVGEGRGPYTPLSLLFNLKPLPPSLPPSESLAHLAPSAQQGDADMGSREAEGREGREREKKSKGSSRKGSYVHLGRRVGLEGEGIGRRAKGLIKGVVEGVEAHRLRSYRLECASMTSTAA